MLTFVGSAFGLSVRINIEQYEYIKGPNPDAGIKVHYLFKLIPRISFIFEEKV